MNPSTRGLRRHRARDLADTSAHGYVKLYSIIFLHNQEVVDMWLANSLNRLGHYLTGSSLSLFVLALAISGCASHTGTVAVDEYNAHPLTVAIPANVSVEFVELAMVRTLNGRDWVVQSQGPEKVVGKLVHRGYNATVTMLADQSVVRIMCDATQTNPSTGEVSPAVPIGWLENLQKDLNAQLSTGQ